MKALFKDRELTLISYYKELLEAEGIETFIRNEALFSVEPIAPFYPELCVVNEADYDKAIKLMREQFRMNESNSNMEQWKCTVCSEDVPGNFDYCWSCGAEKPAS